MSPAEVRTFCLARVPILRKDSTCEISIWDYISLANARLIRVTQPPEHEILASGLIGDNKYYCYNSKLLFHISIISIIILIYYYYNSKLSLEIYFPWVIRDSFCLKLFKSLFFTRDDLGISLAFVRYFRNIENDRWSRCYTKRTRFLPSYEKLLTNTDLKMIFARSLKLSFVSLPFVRTKCARRRHCYYCLL